MSQCKGPPECEILMMGAFLHLSSRSIICPMYVRKKPSLNGRILLKLPFFFRILDLRREVTQHEIDETAHNDPFSPIASAFLP